MASAKVQRYVDLHLEWREEGSIQGSPLHKRVLAARGVLKGREFTEAAQLVQAGLNPPPVAVPGHPEAEVMETVAQAATETAEVVQPPETPAAPKAKKEKKEKPVAVKKAKKPKVESGSIIDSATRKSYTRSDVKTASGARSISNGDDVAGALNGLSEEQLQKVAKRLGAEEAWAKWKTLNPGMKRMNLGNKLRAQIKAGDATAKATLLEAKKLEREHVSKKPPVPHARKKSAA